MRTTLPRTLLLVLALLLVQWAAVAHAGDHQSLSADPHCQLCVHLHQPGGVADAAPALPALSARHEAPVLLATPCIVAARRSLHPIRGPPTQPA